MKTSVPLTLILRLFFAVLFVFMAAGIFAQETSTCAEKLKTAQSYFQKGQVELIPSLLKDCLKSGFKKEEELTAYKLLIQTYLLNDKLGQADSTMVEFLKKNPEYVLSPTDHSSFVYLYNNFVVKPVVQIGLHAGINIPFLTFVTLHPTSGEPSDNYFYRAIGNIYISAESRFKLNERLELGLEAGFSQLKFTNELDFLGFSTITYDESQQRIEVPVSLTYAFRNSGKITPYGRFGGGAAFTLSVSSIATNMSTDKNNNNNLTGQELKRKDSRIAMDWFAQVGGGVKYKIPNGFVFAELRSNLGLLEQNVSGGKTVSTLEYYYKWRDPSFRLNAININIGYTRIFYKPTKRKE